MSSTKGNNEASIEKEKSKFGSTEIHEWHMELHTNNICMDEHNADVRLKKLRRVRLKEDRTETAPMQKEKEQT